MAAKSRSVHAFSDSCSFTVRSWVVVYPCLRTVLLGLGPSKQTARNRTSGPGIGGDFLRGAAQHFCLLALHLSRGFWPRGIGFMGLGPLDFGVGFTRYVRAQPLLFCLIHFSWHLGSPLLL